MPCLSLIIPVYNAEKYLHYCMESILSQTMEQFELILVNDGSTDSSGVLCDKYARQDSRVRVLHQENHGQAVARNKALDIAQGEYIGFIDSDDYIHPKMYEVLIQNAQEYNAQISIGGYRTVFDFESMEEIRELDTKPKAWNGKEFLTHCLLDSIDKKPWVLWDKIFHRSCFDNIRMPEGRINEDNAIVYKILYESDCVVDCNAPFYYYYQNPNSTVNQAFKHKHLEWLLVPQEMIEYFIEKQDEVLLDKAKRMYLSALEDMYRKAHVGLKDQTVDRKLRKDMMVQYQKEKKRYPISIKTHPGLYEILFPKYAKVYWTTKGVLSKFRRK